MYSKLRKNKFQAIKDGQFVSDMRDGSLFNSLSVWWSKFLLQMSESQSIILSLKKWEKPYLK